MNKDLLAQIRASGQAGIARRMYANAEETDSLLRALGSSIAEQHGCTAAFADIKGKDRAAYKVEHKFAGDWYGITDAVRMTIVAPDLSRLKQVQNTIRSTCIPSNGLSLTKDVDLKPEQSPCGYSGLNFVVKLANQRPGEIQVNIPEVMFGQLSRESFCSVLGESAHQQIHRRMGVEGGLGHTFYEIYRVAPGTDKGKEAARVSRLYFDCLRGTLKPQDRQGLGATLAAFKQANAQHFKH